jgi:hypothetical protein
MEKSHLILIKLQCHKQGLCDSTFIHSHKVIKYILMHKVHFILKNLLRIAQVLDKELMS